MKKTEFILTVQKLANKEDFAHNQHLLDVIDSLHYEDFLNCLRMGATIKPSFKALDIIIELSKETALTTEEILHLPRKFWALISLFNMGC